MGYFKLIAALLLVTLASTISVSTTSVDLKYRIKPRSDTCRDVVSNQSRVIVVLSSGLEVMCDTETDGGGWTIFQRRINGKLSFYRGWEEYKYGFGDLAQGEFYLGNEHIHRITVQARHELRIDLGSVLLRPKYFSRYSRFKILGEQEGYKLMINGFSGNAGDSLSYQNLMKFSTYDRNHDLDTVHCAVTYLGAWWYRGCHESNLNGDWGNTKYGKGLNWYTLTGFYLSVDFTEMKFRLIDE